MKTVALEAEKTTWARWARVVRPVKLESGMSRATHWPVVSGGVVHPRTYELVGSYTDAVIESITVEWPSGLEEVFGNILPNQYITLVEGGGTGTGAEPTAGLRIWPPAPNPFHDSVTCRFNLAEARQIDIQVIDIQGKILRNLFSGQIQAGEQRVVWDGTTSDGSPAPAGQYLIVFRQDEKVNARHCVKF